MDRPASLPNLARILAITSAGKSIAAWGEGFSWDGPGGAWVNVER
jgi:hypothetical protein